MLHVDLIVLVSFVELRIFLEKKLDQKKGKKKLRKRGKQEKKKGKKLQKRMLRGTRNDFKKRITNDFFSD